MHILRSLARFESWRGSVVSACLFCTWLLVLPATSRAADDALTAARQLWQRGKYAEAAEAYEALQTKQPVEAAIGVAQCQLSQGEVDTARQTLEQALKQSPENAPLAAHLAQVHFDTGQYAEADRLIAVALKTQPNQLLARWLQAERQRITGKLDEADQAYHWFVDFYNDHDVTTADDLRLVGLAAAQFARWNKLSDQFSFLVNDLYPAALEADQQFWQAHYETGRLYAEKYNEPEARREYAAALKLNPAASEVYAALAELALQKYDLDDALRAAERAIEITPRSLDGKLALADVHVANLSFAEALETLEAARPLNPVSEPLLGRLAGVYAILDALPSSGPRPDQPARFTKLLAEVDERNPHCGEFYLALGATFDLARRYPLASRYYRASVERLPRDPAGYGVLGMTYMRLGEEVEAKRWLDESFERDPFNVRVSNTLKVLEVLENYAVVETEHFVLKFDRGADELLVRYAARYLEEHVYPELCQQLQYQPQGKSLFEIFSRARNTSGHGWFSARMVGLPSIGTVGACAGKMVALASPNDMPKKYNWARVLKHEFVHVLNLQQTDFGIPHWYTEALAVDSEGGTRPPAWDAMLARRVPQGETFNLDTINLGFVRPKSGEDWQMAYCQAQLYAQYLRATYGPDALAKMLAAYADQLTTREALQRCFGVAQEKVEAGYSEHLKKLVAGLGKSAGAARDPAETLKALAAKPDDPDLLAEAAVLRLAKEDFAGARKLADRAIEKQAKHPIASYVLSKVRKTIGDDEQAAKHLADALDRTQPDARVVRELAGQLVENEKFNEAAELYELMAKQQPHAIEWPKALARVYLLSKQEDKLAATLERLALADPDDLLLRKKLAQLALRREAWDEARRWSTEAIWIDVHDQVAHQQLADAYTGLKNRAEVVFQYETLVRLAAKDAQMWYKLAEAYLAANKPDKAREAVEKLLELEPDHAEGLQLRQKLKAES